MTAALQEIIRLVELSLGQRGVSANDRFFEDLKAESADVLNIVATAEERYDVHIAEQELPDIRCAADLHRVIAERSA